MHLGPEGPVGHPARLVFFRGLVEHAHAASRIAFLGAHDGANVVAKLLVLWEPDGRSREDAVGHVGLASEEREVRVILRRAGRALASETVTVGDLSAFHPGAREAEAGVAPHR